MSTISRRRNLRIDASPRDRPLRRLTPPGLAQRFQTALAERDGPTGAHCIHEWWMRGEKGLDIERLQAQLWAGAADSIPEWLPMRYVEWLPSLYEITGRFEAQAKGRSNIYLVLLDYEDRPSAGYGVYVGMSKYSPSQRFDQHKAGIRAAGAVLKRGLEVLMGPTMHLQYIKRTEAVRIEEQLAEVLAANGFLVKGGH